MKEEDASGPRRGGPFAIVKLTLRLRGLHEILLGHSTRFTRSLFCPPTPQPYHCHSLTLPPGFTGFSPVSSSNHGQALSTTRKAVFKCTNEARDQRHRWRLARALSESGRRKNGEKENGNERSRIPGRKAEGTGAWQLVGAKRGRGRQGESKKKGRGTFIIIIVFAGSVRPPLL